MVLSVASMTTYISELNWLTVTVLPAEAYVCTRLRGHLSRRIVATPPPDSSLPVPRAPLCADTITSGRGGGDLVVALWCENARCISLWNCELIRVMCRYQAPTLGKSIFTFALLTAIAVTSGIIVRGIYRRCVHSKSCWLYRFAQLSPLSLRGLAGSLPMPAWLRWRVTWRRVYAIWTARASWCPSSSSLRPS